MSGLPVIGGKSPLSGGGVISNELQSHFGYEPKPSDIFVDRTATRIFREHQKIGITNVRGASLPGFNEDENLYGFSLFQFSPGFLGGWSTPDITSALGFDLSNSMTGGDEISNVSSYFFNLHPNGITVSEPFATHLVPTQGAGIYAESQGAILRSLSISGTTGFRPSISGLISSDPDNVINHVVGENTGFLNFMKLRNVFRNYSDLKKQASQSHKTHLIWYNGKEMEAWFFEPTEFNTTRDASSPFLYRYEIRGTLVQKVYFSSIVSKLSPRFGSLHFYLDMLRTTQSMMKRSVFFTETLSFGSGPDNIVNKFVSTIKEFNAYVADTKNGIFNFVKGVGGVASLPITTVSSAVTAAQSVIRSGKQISDALQNSIAVTDGDKDRLQKMFYDDLFNIENVARNAIRDGQEALKLIQKNSKSSAETALADNARYDSAGSSQQALNLKDHDLKSFVIPKGEKDLKSFCRRVLGNLNHWEVIKKINKLHDPYISEFPSQKTSGASLKGAGDVILLPVPSKYISPNINTLMPYSTTGLSFFEETMGRDLKLIKTTPISGFSQFNLSVNPNGDLDLVEGSSNIVQAIDIKLNTTRGDLPLHPSFGMIPVIGSKGNSKFNLYLSLNDTMLSDGRIEDLSDMSIGILGDTVNVKFKANLIGQLPYVPVDVAVAG